jgi:hypothetical protein
MQAFPLILVGWLTSLSSFLALLLVAASNPPIDKASFDKIKIGMKAKEAYRIVGAVPGEYHSVQPRGFYHIEILSTKGTQKKWKGDCGMIFIWVDGNDIVIDKEFLAPLWPTPPEVEWIRGALGRIK